MLVRVVERFRDRNPRVEFEITCCPFRRDHAGPFEDALTMSGQLVAPDERATVNVRPLCPADHERPIPLIARFRTQLRCLRGRDSQIDLRAAAAELAEYVASRWLNLIESRRARPDEVPRQKMGGGQSRVRLLS